MRSLKSVLCGIFLSANFMLTGSANEQTPVPFVSQYGQDKYVVEAFFQNKRNGVFFDIGAHDGVRASNTYYLEKNLGWTGVCVEPQDDQFAKLVQSRNCICLHGCIYSSSGPKEFLKVSGPSDMLSGILESYHPNHMVRAKREVAELGGSLEVITVQAFTFNEVCKKNGINHIDFLSIDTEGSEEMIIKSIDFDQIDISVIAVENNYRENGIREHLLSRGYSYKCNLAADDIFVKNNFKVQN